MELKVKVTAREIFLFSIHHYIRSMPGMFSLTCVCLAIGVLCAAWGQLQGSVRLMLIIAVLVSTVMQIMTLHRKAVRQATDPVMSRPITFKIDFNGIKVHQGKDKAQINWRQIDKIGKISDIYVLYLNKNHAYLIPERVLGTENKEKFLELLEKYVPAEKRVKI